MSKSLSPEKARKLYGELRDIALATTPSKSGFLPGSLGRDIAYGGLMEFEVDEIFVTLFCVLETAGRYVHVAFYTSAGFAVIGENFPDRVFAAARNFIEASSNFLPEMKETTTFPGPHATTTRFYALTDPAVLTVEVSEEEPEFEALVLAGHAVIAELEKVVPAPAN
jgi:hypothetical protein